jgi:hypothetical protein
MLDVVKTFCIVLPGQVCGFPVIRQVAWCLCNASSMLVRVILVVVKLWRGSGGVSSTANATHSQAAFT